MADALISGLLRKGQEFRPENLRVVEINPDARRKFETKHPGVKCFDQAWKAVREGDILICETGESAEQGRKVTIGRRALCGADLRRTG